MREIDEIPASVIVDVVTTILFKLFIMATGQDGQLYVGTNPQLFESVNKSASVVVRIPSENIV